MRACDPPYVAVCHARSSRGHANRGARPVHSFTDVQGATVATRRVYTVLDEKAQIHQRTVYRAHVFGTGRVPCTLVRDGTCMGLA